jgi:hypothetical protein
MVMVAEPVNGWAAQLAFDIPVMVRVFVPLVVKAGFKVTIESAALFMVTTWPLESV